jgi:predicted PurR-regulated permease PerM
VTEERVVTVRPRTILTTAGVLLALAVAVLVVWVARHALTWVLISLFLAMALNPAVEALQHHGLGRRGAAVATIYLFAVALVAGITALLVPPLVDQIGQLADAAPGYVNDFTHGRGPLGFLETKYHLSNRVRDAVQGQGGGISGGAGTVLSIGRGIVTGIVGVVTIIFLTLFMLLEGPSWTERIYTLVPLRAQPRWRRVGREIYRTVGGYVSGNLLISVIAGTSTTLLLLALGVPFALALGLVVAVLDLIPLAGATLAAIIVALAGFAQSPTDGIVVLAFFIVYQQLENHLLQPLVYGRTVQLSPLAVLISILIGAEVAGVLGALMAIPVAGSIQVVLGDWIENRRSGSDLLPTADSASAPGSPGSPPLARST